jgi:hypothetical protein
VENHAEEKINRFSSSNHLPKEAREEKFTVLEQLFHFSKDLKSAPVQVSLN